MASKIVLMYIALFVVSFSISVLYFQQEVKSENRFQVQKISYDDVEWNNEVTKLLPREGELENGWTPMWSDASESFVHGESPIMIKKTIAGNEVLSTSYSYKT